MSDASGHEQLIAALCAELRPVRPLAPPWVRALGWIAAVVGLGIALALYLIGFMVIGAEWFAMWQSQRWDGRQPAFRILMCIGIIILIVLQDDKDRVGQRD